MFKKDPLLQIITTTLIHFNRKVIWLHVVEFNNILTVIFLHLKLWGRDSAVFIATGYGLGGPGIETRWG